MRGMLWCVIGKDQGKPGLLWGFSGLSTLWIGVWKDIWPAKSLPWRKDLGLYTSKNLSWGSSESSDCESFSGQGAKERVNGLESGDALLYSREALKLRFWTYEEFKVEGLNDFSGKIWLRLPSSCTSWETYGEFNGRPWLIFNYDGLICLL